MSLPVQLSSKVVSILIPVSKSAADTTENGGIGIGEYNCPCPSQIPC